MISKQAFNEQVTDCMEQFELLTNHLFLQNYIEKPEIDEEKLRFLLAMLIGQVPKDVANDIALAMMFVDAALRIHEQVSLHDVQTDYLRKNRQLTVLAGDFYSSLYYRLLSKGDHVAMIKLFSESIQTINERKMEVYRKHAYTFAEFIEDIATIESILLQNIAKFFELSHWGKVMKEYFLLRRFAAEKKQLFVSTNETERRMSYVAIKQVQKLIGIHSEKFAYLMQKTIYQSREQIEARLNEMTTLQPFVREYIEGKLPLTHSYREKIAEEG